MCSCLDCQFSTVGATPVEILAYKQNKNSYNLLIAYWKPSVISYFAYIISNHHNHPFLFKGTDV